MTGGAALANPDLNQGLRFQVGWMACGWRPSDARREWSFIVGPPRSCAHTCEITPLQFHASEVSGLPRSSFSEIFIFLYFVIDSLAFPLLMATAKGPDLDYGPAPDIGICTAADRTPLSDRRVCRAPRRFSPCEPAPQPSPRPWSLPSRVTRAPWGRRASRRQAPRS